LFVVLAPEAPLTDLQFAALRKTLEDSRSPLRFVFSHNRPRGREFHQLMVKSHVNTVFHGHDHVLTREEADGVVYQSVPQPANPHASSGHLTVSVQGREARVNFILTADKPPLHSARSTFH